MRRGLVEKEMRDSDSFTLVRTGKRLRHLTYTFSLKDYDMDLSGFAKGLSLKSLETGRLLQKIRYAMSTEKNRKLKKDFSRFQKEQIKLDLPPPPSKQAKADRTRPVASTSAGRSGLKQRIQRAQDGEESDRELIRHLVKALAEIQQQLRGGRTFAEDVFRPLVPALPVLTSTTKTNVPPQQGYRYVKVSCRGKRRSSQATAVQETPAGTNSVNSAAPLRAAMKNRKRMERCNKARETAAVSLTCKEDVGYMAALTKANNAINLKDIGIGGLPWRRDFNGAFIWPVCRKAARANAEKVAKALRRALSDAKISVQQRCSSI
ncbi:hypothetical protein M0804_013351 [Polistes exclamans]|nr:hypothetical protein M0804_013351 [Polistes exclamans]